MNRLNRLLSIFIIVYGIIPPVTASGINTIDPYEDFNRVTHRFNETLDDYVARPAATLYHNAMPDP